MMNVNAKIIVTETIFLKKIVSVTIIFIIAMIFLPCTVHSQVNTQTSTKEIDRPIRQDIQKRMRTDPIDFPVPIKKIEKVIEGPSFLLNSVELIGVVSLPDIIFASTIREYKNKVVGFEELNELATKIQMIYLDEGILAACFLPEQEIKNGKDLRN